MKLSKIKLSIVVPVYNEEKTIDMLLAKLARLRIAQVAKEILIVDDASHDTSARKAVDFAKKHKGVKFIQKRTNEGKGSAVREGVKRATGDYVIVQDADLEYDPGQIASLIAPILRRDAQVVYGTRLNRLPDFSRDERIPLFMVHYAGNRLLSLITSLLYGQWITDMETCYKVFPREAVADMKIEARGFEFEPEITAKLIKKGYRIYEVPIRTTPRGYDEGKKLHTVKDGIRALLTLLKYRFIT